MKLILIHAIILKVYIVGKINILSNTSKNVSPQSLKMILFVSKICKYILFIIILMPFNLLGDPWAIT